MRDRRLTLGIVAGSLAMVGAWAQAFPASFYTDFPLGRAWVSADGPYNEHLVRDVGGLNLALAAAVAVAAVLGSALLMRVTAIGVLLYSAPHFTYHALHLAPYGTGDRVALLLLLGLLVAAPILVALAPIRRAPQASPAPAD